MSEYIYNHNPNVITEASKKCKFCRPLCLKAIERMFARVQDFVKNYFEVTVLNANMCICCIQLQHKYELLVCCAHVQGH